MVDEFSLPPEIIDRRVTKMKMISPSNREVDVGKTLNDTEWIGMCRREVRREMKTDGAILQGFLLTTTTPAPPAAMLFAAG